VTSGHSDKITLEDALRESEERFLAAAEQTPDAIIQADANGRLTYANAAASRMFGYQPGEMLQEPLVQLVPERYREAHRAGISRYLDTRQAHVIGRTVELAGRRKSGSEFPIELSLASRETAGGTIFTAIIRDITERKLAEKALATSLSLLQATLESTTDGILAIDLSGKITGFNQRLIEMWHLSAEVLAQEREDQVVSHLMTQVMDAEAFLSSVEEVRANPNGEPSDLLELRDGRVFERYSRAQRVDGLSVGRVWSFRDVTERRRLELQLLRAQKLEAAGRIAGQVAHDFNNMLAPLVAYPQLIKRRFPEGHFVGPLCDAMLHAAQRIAEVNDDLLAMGRRGLTEEVPVDLK
jgi:PAS domain S-box-containing protein